MSGAPRDVDDWFARRTFHTRDYALPDLVVRRRAERTTVSVVLPTRNEHATVAAVVESAVSLSPDLVDEVVVIDADSTDGTPDIAARAGALVHTDSRLPPGGPCLGKGDALWRSLSVTSGDLVVFVDTDIRNPAPDFFLGLLGPLLTDPSIRYVKAFYDRPIEVGGRRQASGGGRVTELLVRPLLNLHWPELAGVAQPLSGEYAGRRELLERLPFFTGYGVEFGLLIDTLEFAGVDAIAQVDLGMRIHRNQPLDALSRMGFGIAQVVARRLETQGRAQFASPLDNAYRQMARDAEGRLQLQFHQVEITVRPPLR